MFYLDINVYSMYVWLQPSCNLRRKFIHKSTKNYKHNAKNIWYENIQQNDTQHSSLQIVTTGANVM